MLGGRCHLGAFLRKRFFKRLITEDRQRPPCEKPGVLLWNTEGLRFEAQRRSSALITVAPLSRTIYPFPFFQPAQSLSCSCRRPAVPPARGAWRRRGRTWVNLLKAPPLLCLARPTRQRAPDSPSPARAVDGRRSPGRRSGERKAPGFNRALGPISPLLLLHLGSALEPGTFLSHGGTGR